MGDIWGWLILASFFLPVFGGVLVMVLVSVMSILGPLGGLGFEQPHGKTMRIKENYYDYDEDY
jgi:hypothetical protein